MVKPVRPIRIPRDLRSAPPAQVTVGLAVIFRDNVDTIDKLLASVAGHFDEFSFTDTGSVDGTRQKIESFLKGKPGKISDFAWCDDFASARQFSFERLSTSFRMFLDSDDRLDNGERLRVIVQTLTQKHPQIKGVFIPYDYDVDESLATMRLCKWTCGGGKWSWKDAIHERLEFDAADPAEQWGAESFARSNEISVWHRRKSEAEKARAIARNSVIALREYATATDPKYRARLARTIAMEMKLQGLAEPALPYYEEVYAGYPSLPEGRQAAADAMKSLLVLNRTEEALEWAKKAGPSYEALVLHAMGRWQECIDRQTRGSVAGQQTTHEGFLFEKAAAVVAQAEAALFLNYPPESVEKVLNTIRADLREHPMHHAGTVKCRATIDRITIVVPGTPQPFDANSGGTMLGGSEEAVVYLSKALADLGRNVRVYTPLPPTTLTGVDAHGVDWQEMSSFDYHHEHGTLVVWRSGQWAANLLGRIQQIHQRTDTGQKEGNVPFTGILGSSFWLHDRSLGLAPDVGLAVCRAFDSVVVLSEHHRRCIIAELGGRDPGNIVTLSNGIVANQFAGLAENPERDPHRAIYSSCPSRGLRTLLEQWPAVKEAVPEAKLDLYYDWSGLRDMQPDLYTDVMAKYESVRHLGVHHHGGVGHAELNAALSKANVWAYAHFENTATETSCISAMKSTAAGATVLTTNAGALPETSPESDRTDDVAEYTERLIGYLQNPEAVDVRVGRAIRMMNRFDWAEVAVGFSDLWKIRPLTERLSETNLPA